MSKRLTSSAIVATLMMAAVTVWSTFNMAGSESAAMTSMMGG